MSCNIPTSHILRFLDSELTDKEKKAFLEHLEACEACSKKLDIQKQVIAELKKNIPEEKPPMKELLQKITPYSSKKQKRAGFWRSFRRLALPLAAVLVLALLVAIPTTRSFLGRSFIAIFDKEKRLTSGDSSQNGVLTFTDQFDQKTGESLVQELNAKGMGVSAWEVLYASKDRILIRNFASLLVYSNGQLKKAADLEALGLNHIQGSVVTDLTVSPDGRYVIAGNEVHEGENAEKETGTYLLEVESGRYTRLSQQGPEYTAYAWSFNGEWLALAKKQGTDKIRLINCNSLEQKTLPIEETNIKTLFVSNSGKYAYDTGDKIFVQDNKWHGGSPQRPVYVDAQTSKMWFIDTYSNLCSMNVGSDLLQVTLLDRNGGSKLIAWRVIGSTFVFLLEGGDIGYVNLQNGDLMTFSLKSKIDTDYLPWCTVSDNGTLLIDRDGRAQILSKSGEYFYDYPAISGMALYMRLMDNEHMVSIKLLDEQNPKAGEFAIQEMSVETGETTELYRTVGGTPSESHTPTPTPQATKTFFNRTSLKDTARIYTEADSSSPLVAELMQRLSDPNQSKEINLYDEVVNGFVHVESDDGLSGWVSEKDLYYYDNYKTFSYEKDSIDLNGDGKPDKIALTSGDNYTLQVNDATIEGSGIDVIDQFRIVDIDPNDAYKEIVVEETGPSSDTMSSFYTYDGSQLHFMGKLEGLCGNSDAVKGDGRVIATTRGNILETWFYKDPYTLNSQHDLERVPQTYYHKITYSEEPMIKVLIPEINFYEAPDSSKVSMVLKQGDGLRFVASDDKEWCQFETADGKQGWIKIESGKVSGTDLSPDEIFKGLSHAD